MSIINSGAVPFPRGTGNGVVVPPDSGIPDNAVDFTSDTLFNSTNRGNADITFLGDSASGGWRFESTLTQPNIIFSGGLQSSFQAFNFTADEFIVVYEFNDSQDFPTVQTQRNGNTPVDTVPSMSREVITLDASQISSNQFFLTIARAQTQAMFFNITFVGFVNPSFTP